MEERGGGGGGGTADEAAAHNSHCQRLQDAEKIGPNLAPVTSRSNTTDLEADAGHGAMGYMKSFERMLIRYNMEARGIQRVMPEDRHSLSRLGFGQIGILWFSINLAANNITLGMLGPAVFHLSFLEASLCGCRHIRTQIWQQDHGLRSLHYGLGTSEGHCRS
jgi:hypothetical protein